MEWGFSSIDGSKLLANNLKDNNFKKNKLDDRIRWLNAYTDEYLRIMKDLNEQEELEETPDKLTREVITRNAESDNERSPGRNTG